ncbi:Hypothetical predicted protein [Mytilus galloprovincialis]|uniref:Uncharacterized protein n=1 Tax=Mytilus galloprovincialis TaxID=29158 RepID=A0A8B6EXP5_MYTGA|nr:Hypothetical predicted protein [Mytilus galloprovincialis]
METNQKSAIEFRENKYIAKLPWKLDHEPLPTNFFVTKRRTENVIRKLSQDPEMVKVYGQIIKDQERRGFIEKVKDPDISKEEINEVTPSDEYVEEPNNEEIPTRTLPLRKASIRAKERIKSWTR